MCNWCNAFRRLDLQRFDESDGPFCVSDFVDGPPPFGPGEFKLSVMYSSMEYGGGSEVEPIKTSVGSS